MEQEQVDDKKKRRTVEEECQTRYLADEGRDIYRAKDAHGASGRQSAGDRTAVVPDVLDYAREVSFPLSFFRFAVN